MSAPFNQLGQFGQDTDVNGRSEDNGHSSENCFGDHGLSHWEHGHSHGEHGHSHGIHDGNDHGASGEEENGDDEIVTTLSELVPGAALRNLVVRVKEIKEAGEAEVESAHGLCKLVYDVDMLSAIVREGSVLRILDGFGYSQESGNLVIRLEDPETESIVVETDVDEDEVTPPPEFASRNISSISRLFGLLVIREDRCLLCPADATQDKFSFPISEADGDEPERTAALRAFQYLTDIDVNEIYLLHDVPPSVSYEEDFVSTLFVAYSRRPFKKNRPPTNTEKYSWFTFDEALDVLETDASKQCLKRLALSLNSAVEASVLKPNFEARFRPSTSSLMTAAPSIPDTQVSEPETKDDVGPLVARTSALFYLVEQGLISQNDFSRFLAANQPPAHQKNQPIQAAVVALAKQPSKTSEAIPVTVLCGFLGSGKTTLVNHLMDNREGLKIALLVNDMAEINVDAKKIADKANEQVIELSNGCICCTLREDLLTEIQKLALSNKYDCIVVESTGIGDPMGIAETFTFPLTDGRTLNDIARLDTVVTVIDSSSLMKDMNLKGKISNDDSGKLSKLLTDQIEFANVIVLNKLDLVNVDEMTKVRGIVSNLNPRARKIECIRSAVALGDVINTKLFSFDEAQSSPGWLKTLRGEEIPESEEFGIGNVVWRANQPVSPSKLAQVLTQSPFCDAIIRSKGVVWLASELGKTTSIEWAGAGHSYEFYQGKKWVSQHESSGKPKGLCEVVFIGFFDDKSVPEHAVAILNKCLVPVDEQGDFVAESDEFIQIKQG